MVNPPPNSLNSVKKIPIGIFYLPDLNLLTTLVLLFVYYNTMFICVYLYCFIFFQL